ncbi:RraA family protein [Companilactobacillus allii]|uniref:Putative 4-hydroxy-4-methyl-2-oxoglutarate aldolase n=1 Tax=Companilactobacillus allii TaxID=1847728 RepID=A0A1P8Q1K9_9LACO|nr:RraA family protein [Companilactobacillus allii]APX71715.1 methyltransferase [Companilactobacillus allii]USQ68803.1 RraA family protein [Companilactobacillus allii]
MDKNVGCQIISDFKRPSKDLINLFKDIPVANIDDCMNRQAAVSPDIKPMNKTPLLGPAFTVQVPQGDNLMFHKAMDLAKPGDVIVIDAAGGTRNAIFGEIMLTYCQSRGLAGVIVDGCVRDKAELNNMTIAAYAKAVVPNGPYKNGPGKINVPITFGGKVVKPGDIVVGDSDGLIFIDPNDAQYLAEKAHGIMEKEAKIKKTIRNDGEYSRPWVDDKLADINCNIQ